MEASAGTVAAITSTRRRGKFAVEAAAASAAAVSYDSAAAP